MAENNKKKLLVYGSYGYTGQLIVEELKRRGMDATLAGRNAEKVKKQAESFGFDHFACDLADTEKLENLLSKFETVLHCAGPFHRTVRPMVKACLATHTNYLDITGEIAVFEYCNSKNSNAKESNIMLMPGVGFDVVPSDCISKHLSNQMPDANQLDLGFYSIGGRLSHGTATTMVEGLNQGGAIRKDGIITKVEAGSLTKTINFQGKDMLTAAIPWGDVSTAFYSTNIPNIITWFVLPPKSIKRMKNMKYLGWLLGSSPVQKFLKKKIKAQPAGPNEAERTKSSALIWGQVTNPQNQTKTAILSCPNGYTLTAYMAVEIAEKVGKGEKTNGFQTPSLVYGPDLVLNMPNTSITELN